MADLVSGLSHQWTSISATFGKARKTQRNALSDEEVVFLPPGSRLQGRLVGEIGSHLVIDNAIVDGTVPIKEEICFFTSAHWTETTPTPVTMEELADNVWSFGEVGKPAACHTFHFAENSRIGGYKNVNEGFWRLENGELQILNESGRLTWRFGPLIQDGAAARLVGFYAPNPLMELYFELRRQPSIAGPEAPTRPIVAVEGKPEDDSVKLVIWDLDETFWLGTLAEGTITAVPAHLEFVRTLTARGIVNGICSKNDFAAAEAMLRRLGIWEFFIFPRIAFAPKGSMVADIIDSAQLRAPSVLFLDDNPMNLEEARHYNPGIQTADPAAIPQLLTDSRLRGKPDPRYERLAHYKILEQKRLKREESTGGNLEFLRQSDVRISFHHDLMSEFPRLHDLVNRTNQLNFTKRRWSENETEARAQLSGELEENFNSHAGYVKVADKYGDYGICGFYLVGEDIAQHFLFSCRSLNMGIEQFVWHKVGRPFVPVSGEVVSTFGPKPDWISVVENATAAPVDVGAVPRRRLCVRSACDLLMMTHYLRTGFETIEEFTFPYQGWGIHPAARAVAVAPDLQHGEGAGLLARIPGMPPKRFDSAILSGEADVYVLSFVSEIFSTMHRSRSTGLILPFACGAFGSRSFAEVSYEDMVKAGVSVGMTSEQWCFMQEEFEALKPFDKALLAADVSRIFEMLHQKTVIVLMLNSKIGNDSWLLNRFAEINDLVRTVAQAFGCHIVEMNDFVCDAADLAEPDGNGAHFARSIYMRLAERVAKLAARDKGSCASRMLY
ncbi:phosphatase [Acidisoma cladoniae]|uniref:phosphatase n=1 Tax=Acidisoma cladoniae TaxID=3040935 RepID=UPI00254F20C0|nr:phosphatase [Acidisoma sp. PAMC 29798]